MFFARSREEDIDHAFDEYKEICEELVLATDQRIRECSSRGTAAIEEGLAELEQEWIKKDVLLPRQVHHYVYGVYERLYLEPSGSRRDQ